MAHKRNSVEVPELEKLLAGKKKKYVRYEEGAVLYSMGKNSFRQVAQDAHAIVRLKRIALVNVLPAVRPFSFHSPHRSFTSPAKNLCTTV